MKIIKLCQKIIKILVFLSLFLNVNFVFAQSPVNDRLTLNGLVNEVINRNAGLTAQELRIRAKRELVNSADALSDPRVSYSIAPSSFGDEIPSDFGNALGVRQVIQLSQSFPWPGKLSLRTELAETEAALAQYTYDELLLTLVNESRSLWSEFWYVEQALSTNAEHQELLLELEGVAATQYANGLGLQQDILQIQTSLVELKYLAANLSQERRRIQARINNLLNRSSENPLPSPEADFSEPPIPSINVLHNWMQEAYPELLILETESDRAFTQFQLVEKEDLPDIQLNMGYNEIMNNSSLRFQVGISINIPFDFGNRTARKSAANYEYSSILSDITRLKYELEAEMEQALSRYEEHSENIRLFEEEFLPLTEQTFNAASANYEGGGGNFETLVDVQQQLLNVRLQIALMQAEKLMILSELDNLSGGLLWSVENF